MSATCGQQGGRAPSATSGEQRCCHGNMAYLPDSFRAVYFLLIPRGITSNDSTRMREDDAGGDGAPAHAESSWFKG